MIECHLFARTKTSMETNEEDFFQTDETEWIERQTHERILRKHRQNTQRLIKEFQTQIQQQNRKIEILMKEVKRQKSIINTCSCENNNNESLNSTKVEQKNESSKIEETSDLELETYVYPETKMLIKTKDQNQNSPNFNHLKIAYKRTTNNGHAVKTQRKKSALLSIHIQPNIQHSTNVYICDQCNKKMSSRRVLAVFWSFFDSIHEREFFIIYRFYFFISETQKNGSLFAKRICV